MAMTIAEGYSDNGVFAPPTSRDAPSAATIKRGRAGIGRVPTSGFNLRAVVDVLTAEGLDPTAEIAKILKAQKPVMHRNGTPALDADGEPLMEPVLDGDTRAKVLLELQQYVHPKLKAVEVKMTGPTMSDEQIDARLKHLLSQEQKT